MPNPCYKAYGVGGSWLQKRTRKITRLTGLIANGDTGKENGDYYNILGLYGDNGKENGNYYNT